MTTVVCLAAVLAGAVACSSFGEDPASATQPIGDGGDAGAVLDGASEGAPATPAAFCPVPGAVFCSDFEQGDLTAEWLPEATPTKFLSLVAAGDHGSALHAKLTTTSVMAAKSETLQTELGKPATVTYAFDLRVEQKAAAQSVEVASLRTADSMSTLAFHILLSGNDFAYAEYTKLPVSGYDRTALLPIDEAWHRFEVEVSYGPPVKVVVRADGKVLVDRAPNITFTSVPLSPLQLAVGVQNIAQVTGDLAYSIDNVTVFAKK